MLTAGTDFEIEDEHGIIRCLPKTDEVSNAFKVLQMRLIKLASQLPEAPPVAVSVDGIIGPATTLTMQMIALRLAEGVHQELAAFAIAQPEDAIPLCAANAMELAGYLDTVIANDAQALAAPTPAPEPVFDPIAMVKDYFTRKRIAAVSATLCGIGGLALVATVSQKRSQGFADRSNLLPPSDGSDEYEDEADDEDVEDVEAALVEPTQEPLEQETNAA